MYSVCAREPLTTFLLVKDTIEHSFALSRSTSPCTARRCAGLIIFGFCSTVRPLGQQTGSPPRAASCYETDSPLSPGFEASRLVEAASRP
eukprot:998336-Prymnesium_polylepis.1